MDIILKIIKGIIDKVKSLFLIKSGKTNIKVIQKNSSSCSVNINDTGNIVNKDNNAK